MNKQEKTTIYSSITDWKTNAPAEIYNTSKAEYYTISQLSKEFSVTLRALRFYESKHLLRPERKGNARYYGPDDCKRLALILKGKRLGFTLAKIRELLAEQTGQQACQSLGLTAAQCADQIRTLETEKSRIENAITELRHTQALLA